MVLVLAVLLMVTAVLAGTGAVTGHGLAGASTPLSIAVSGDHFVNGDDQTVRLLGVDVPGTEYACEEGWGYSSLPISPASADAIAAWHADAVRVPLNEDCWLGINDAGFYGTPSGYQQAIESWVTDLHAAGLYVILDLHWSAPGTNVANGQRPMPDDHSAAFWQSVASTFKSDPAVVFDAFNEPYSPEGDGDSSLAVSWSCWENGGCTLPVAEDGTSPNDSVTYTAVGMQALVTAIRGTGATQPIMLGGLSYSNDLSGWLANEPLDPDGQLVASFHEYQGNACDSASCWNSTVATVAASVPVVTGEFDEGFDCADPPTGDGTSSDFDNTYMNWADAHGVSYLAWGWYDLGNSGTTCADLGGGGGAYSLISDDTGTPVAPDGTDLQGHLTALAAAASPPTTTTTSTSTTSTSTTTTTTTTTTSTTTTSTTTTTTTTRPGTTPTTSPGSTPTTTPTVPATPGYDLVGSDGGVFVFPTGRAGGFFGSLPGLGVQVHDVVGIVPSSDDRGYFLVGSDGGVFSFGDTSFEGSLPGLHVTVDDIVGIIPTNDDRGYTLVGKDGGVFAFGDAHFLGSLPGDGVEVHDVVGIADAANGAGYWLVEANGAVSAFGSAAHDGNASVGSSPVAGIAADPGGTGYWVLTANGGIQPFGSAAFHGSLPELGVVPSHPVVALVPTPDGGGYWLFGSDGGVFAFGDAGSLGSLPGLHVVVGDIVGAVPTAS